MSDTQNWGRHGPGIRDMNALTQPIGEKVNYFVGATLADVLEILPGQSGTVVLEVEAGSFRCRAGKLAARVFTAEADDDKLTQAGHPYVNEDGPLRVSNSAGALPAGLTADTDYWIIDRSGDTFRLSLTKKGARVALTSDGTGTNSIGGDNGAAVAVGFAPAEPTVTILAVGGKLLATGEIQVFDCPVSISPVTGAGDILAWWIK